MATMHADHGMRADKRKRYPLDTPEATRRAAMLMGQDANRAKYSAEQLAMMDDRIAKAKKKHGITKAAADVAAPLVAAQPVALTAADVQRMIAEAVAKAGPAAPLAAAAPVVDLAPVTAAVDGLRAEFMAHKAAIDGTLATAKAGEDAARVSEAAAVAKAAATEATLRAVTREAASPTATGGVPRLNADGTTTPHPATFVPVGKAAPEPPPGSSDLQAAIHARMYADQA